MKNRIFILIPLLFSGIFLYSQESGSAGKISKSVELNISRYYSLYRYLHEHPELSFQEFSTSERMASELGELGFEITRNFGGTGVVGIYRNGMGPVVMIRTDMDALPIEEKTGLPYASKVVATDWNGNQVGVMHACGHDIHMTVWTGVARTLTDLKDQWQGTLIMIAQQAEERSGGADQMIEEGLFTRFPVPDYALALHISAEIPSTVVGYCPGATAAGVNSADITVYGEGGHGAYPHKTKDPVVLASRIILDLQTVVSRELSPLEPAVVTVGSVHGGTQHNIIPDQVKLQLTIRFYDDMVYRQIIEAIHRITTGIAASAGLQEEKYPDVKIYESYTPPVLNDPELTGRAVESFCKILGEENVMKVEPTMAGEDFGRYGRTPEKVPIFMFWLGTVNHMDYTESRQQGTALPPLHSPHLAPDYQNSIVTGIKAMSQAVLDLFNQ
ncbi:MAG: amidohydrolase [Bacteroidales bacterium]|nr:MAG: amidohydrolase [Bacteroidales bacterium]